MKPAEKFYPAALAAMSQSAFGIVCLPPDSYGPCTLSLIGSLSCLMPLSLMLTSRSMRALLIGVENALFSVASASLELPLPQAARTAANTARLSGNRARQVRAIGRQGTPPHLKSAQHGSKDHPLHGQGRRRQDQRCRRHGAPLRRGRFTHDRAFDRPGALVVGFA